MTPWLIRAVVLLFAFQVGACSGPSASDVAERLGQLETDLYGAECCALSGAEELASGGACPAVERAWADSRHLREFGSPDALVRVAADELRDACILYANAVAKTDLVEQEAIRQALLRERQEAQRQAGRGEWPPTNEDSWAKYSALTVRMGEQWSENTADARAAKMRACQALAAWGRVTGNWLCVLDAEGRMGMPLDVD